MENRTLDGAAGEWRSKPMSVLIERLIGDHRTFREHDLPGIERRLELLKSELGLAPAPAVEALADFRAFKQGFAWHMDEEESFLFPKILRTEACLHDPGLYPEVFKGSIAVFSSSHIHLPEETFRDMLNSLSRKVRALPIDPAKAAPMQEILSTLTAFGSTLTAHTYLESEILFPWAAETEDVLRNRAAKKMS